MLVAVMMIAVAPAFAGGRATQMWRCELHDDATEEQVAKAAQKWLAAAKTMKGGKNLEASVYFPVAVNNTGQSDIIFVDQRAHVRGVGRVLGWLQKFSGSQTRQRKQRSHCSYGQRPLGINQSQISGIEPVTNAGCFLLPEAIHLRAGSPTQPPFPISISSSPRLPNEAGGWSPSTGVRAAEFWTLATKRPHLSQDFSASS